MLYVIIQNSIYTVDNSIMTAASLLYSTTRHHA